MVRSSGSIYTRQRRRRQCSRKGFRNCTPGRYRLLIQKVKKAQVQQTVDRKYRKRQTKSLWLKRISGALKLQSKVYQLSNKRKWKTRSYSTWIHCLHVRGSRLNKKIMAQMALGNPAFFYRLSLWAIV